MTINRGTKLRPLLSRYEVEITQQPARGRVEYDDAAMILTVDGKPAVNAPSTPVPPKPTRLTFVGAETTDDD